MSDRFPKWHPNEMKTFGFGFRALKKYYELIPITAFVSGVAVLGILSSAYHLNHNFNVWLFRSDYPRYEKAHPEKPSKLLKLRSSYKKIPELEQLHCMIGLYRPEQTLKLEKKDQIKKKKCVR